MKKYAVKCQTQEKYDYLMGLYEKMGWFAYGQIEIKKINRFEKYKSYLAVQISNWFSYGDRLDFDDHKLISVKKAEMKLRKMFPEKFEGPLTSDEVKEVVRVSNKLKSEEADMLVNTPKTKIPDMNTPINTKVRFRDYDDRDWMIGYFLCKMPNRVFQYQIFYDGKKQSEANAINCCKYCEIMEE